MSTAAPPKAQAPSASLSTSAIQEILGKVRESGRLAMNTVRSQSFVDTSYYTNDSFKQYALRVLMFSLLYVFLAFLILLIVHYSVQPVFRFVPGGIGLIPISTASDDKIYWNDKKQPVADSRVPLLTDALAQYPFDNNFTVSVDLYIRRPTDSSEGHRVVFYKTYKSGTGTGIVPTAATAGTAAIAGTADITNPVATLATPPGNTQDLITKMAPLCSMMAYLDGNDLFVVMFTGQAGSTQLSTPAIKNIPVYQPFRLSVIVETSLFTVYINEKQVFQRINSGTSGGLQNQIRKVSYSPTQTSTEFFYSPSAWVDQPTKTIFLQNFHLWPRALTYSELKAAQPSLAAEADFNLPVEANSASCSSS